MTTQFPPTALKSPIAKSMEWYIKIYRQLLDWEWYTDTPTKSLFIHLLLKANIKDWNWRWTPVQKWSLITGRKKLSEELWLTESQIRTSLEKLVSTNEIAIKTTKSFSVVLLNNWDKYQDQIANKVPNQSPTNRQPIATGGKGNKERSKESDTEIGVSIETSPRDETREFFESLENNIEEVIISINSDPEHREVLRAELFKFYNYWCEKTPDWKKVRWQTEKTFEVKRRLTTWLMNTKQFTSNQSQYVKKPRVVG